MVMVVVPAAVAYVRGRRRRAVGRRAMRRGRSITRIMIPRHLAT